MIPASIRTKNPGAMWPGPVATKFGSTSYERLHDAQGNKIAIFPTYAQGIAAEFYLWKTKYTGKTLGSAIKRWSGDNSPEAYARRLAEKTGWTMDTILTPDMLAGPKGIEFMKAQSQWEAGQPYPASDEEWANGQSLAFSTGKSIVVPNLGAPHHTAAVAVAVMSAAASTHAGFSPWIIGLSAIAAGIVVYLTLIRRV